MRPCSSRAHSGCPRGHTEDREGTADEPLAHGRLDMTAEMTLVKKAAVLEGYRGVRDCARAIMLAWAREVLERHGVRPAELPAEPESARPAP